MNACDRHPELTSKIRELLTYAEHKQPHFVPFQITEDKEFRSILRILCKNADGEVKKSVLLEWYTRDQQWTTSSSQEPVFGTAGRIGRLRLRQSRAHKRQEVREQIKEMAWHPQQPPFHPHSTTSPPA